MNVVAKWVELLFHCGLRYVMLLPHCPMFYDSLRDVSSYYFVSSYVMTPLFLYKFWHVCVVKLFIAMFECCLRIDEYF